MFDRMMAVALTAAVCLGVSAQTGNPLPTAPVVARYTYPVASVTVNEVVGKLTWLGSGFAVSAGGAAAAAAPVPQEPKPESTSPATPDPYALINVYRLGRMLGALGHPAIFINHEYMGELDNSSYVQYRLGSGTVVVTATFAIIGPDVPGEGSVRARVEIQAEAGKTYYLKWSVSGGGGKMQLMDAAKGAKEIKGLHPVHR